MLSRHSRTAGIIIVCLLLGFAASYFPARFIGTSRASDRSRTIRTDMVVCKPGPWGDLSYVPFTVSAPEDLLPIQTILKAGTHWHFGGYTPDALVSFLESTTLTPDQQRAFLDPSVMHAEQEGIDLTPSPELVNSLSDASLAQIYRTLLPLPQPDELETISAADIDSRFASTGAAPQSVALFKRLSYRQGDYFIIPSVAAILSLLPDYDERLRVARAISQQQTMLLRLHITPRSDVETLAQYWGKNCFNTDIRTVLKSLSVIPEGTYINVVLFLPSGPAGQVYNFQTVTDNPLDGPAVNRDCAWTALNFFREIPNPDFGKLQPVMKELRDNYTQVHDAPRYGDVMLFSKPNGAIVHAAVYIADDICFTKNGSALVNPWIFATIPSVAAQYSYQIDSSEKPAINYFRLKNL